MSIAVILDMALAGDPARTAVVDEAKRFSVADIDDLAAHGAGLLHQRHAKTLAYLGTGGAVLPPLIFAAARAGVTFTPLNYRLSAYTLRALIQRLDRPIIVCDNDFADTVAQAGADVLIIEDYLAQARQSHTFATDPDPDAVAVILFTSGTTSRPKAVQLTHTNLTSYVTGTVEYGSADSADAALICVPPYHIAGLGTVLTNLYAGRRLVYQRDFDAPGWLSLVARENVTTATVVPTMLDRIITELAARPVPLPSLRNLAYGGARVSAPLVRRTLDLLPHVGLVNAYGLTETSSTIAVLTPEDHRAALASTDTDERRRLASVGRPIPGIEVQIRDDRGSALPPGSVGELYVRGEQVSGHYADIGSVLDADGWFPTRDQASQDHDGYLFILGRADDTIIRGGENIAPAEVEDVLVEHPDVHEAAVIGVDDSQWGQALVAVVVSTPAASPDAQELREFVRTRLRGSRTPDRIVFHDALPTNATGKVLRRELREQLHADAPAGH